MHFRKSVSASNPINKLVLQTNQMCNYATYNMNICTKYINSRQTICDGRQEEALQWQWRWFCFWFWFVHVSYEIKIMTRFYIYTLYRANRIGSTFRSILCNILAVDSSLIIDSDF